MAKHRGQEGPVVEEMGLTRAKEEGTGCTGMERVKRAPRAVMIPNQGLLFGKKDPCWLRKQDMDPGFQEDFSAAEGLGWGLGKLVAENPKRL